VEAERALELDPASTIVNNMLGVVFYESRNYDGAIAPSPCSIRPLRNATGCCAT
jgi:hypothetical protein